MLNCREVSELVSRELDQKLPQGRRLALRMHLLLCGGCRRVRGQFRMLNQLLAGRFQPSGPVGSAGEAENNLPEPARKRIKAALRDAAPGTL